MDVSDEETQHEDNAVLDVVRDLIETEYGVGAARHDAHNEDETTELCKRVQATNRAAHDAAWSEELFVLQREHDTASKDTSIMDTEQQTPRSECYTLPPEQTWTRERIVCDLEKDFQTHARVSMLAPFIAEHHVRPLVDSERGSRLRDSVPSLYTQTVRETTVLSERQAVESLHAAIHTVLTTAGVPELFIEPLQDVELTSCAVHASAETDYVHAYATGYRRLMLARARAANVARILNDMTAQFREAAAELDKARNALFWQHVLAVVAQRRRAQCRVSHETSAESRREALSDNKQMDETLLREFQAHAKSVRIHQKAVSHHVADQTLLSATTLRLSTRDVMFFLQRANCSGAKTSGCACEYVSHHVRRRIEDAAPFEHALPLFSNARLFPMPRTLGSAQSLVWTYMLHDRELDTNDTAQVLGVPLAAAYNSPHETECEAEAVDNYTVWDAQNFRVAEFHSHAPRWLEQTLRKLPSRAPDASFVKQVLRMFVQKNARGESQLNHLAKILDRGVEARALLDRIDNVSVAYHYTYRETVGAAARLHELYNHAVETIDACACYVQHMCDKSTRADAYPLLQSANSMRGLTTFFPSVMGADAYSSVEHATLAHINRFGVPELTHGDEQETQALSRHPQPYWFAPAPVDHLACIHATKQPHTLEIMRNAVYIVDGLQSIVESAFQEAVSLAPLDAFAPYEKPRSLSEYANFYIRSLLDWQDGASGPYNKNADPAPNAVLVGTSIRRMMFVQREFASNLHDLDERSDKMYLTAGMNPAKPRPRPTTNLERLRYALWDINVPGRFLVYMQLLSGGPLAGTSTISHLVSTVYATLATLVTPYNRRRVVEVYYAFVQAIMGVDCNGRLRTVADPDELATNQTKQFKSLRRRLFIEANGDMVHEAHVKDTMDLIEHRIGECSGLRAVQTRAMLWNDFLTPDYNHAKTPLQTESIHVYTMSQYEFNRTFWQMVDVPETRALHRTRVVFEHHADTWQPDVDCDEEYMRDWEVAEQEFENMPALQRLPCDTRFRSEPGPDFYDCDFPERRLFAAPCAYATPYRAGRVPLLAGDTYICDDNGVANILTEIESRPNPRVFKKHGFRDDIHGTRMLMAPYPGAFEQVRRGDFILIRQSLHKRHPYPQFYQDLQEYTGLFNRQEGFAANGCTVNDFETWKHTDELSAKHPGEYCYVAVVHAVFPHAHVSIPLCDDKDGAFHTGALLVSRAYPLKDNVTIDEGHLEQMTQGLVPSKREVRAGTVYTVLGAALQGEEAHSRMISLSALYNLLHETVQSEYAGDPAGYFRSAATRQLLPHFDTAQEARHVAKAAYAYQQADCKMLIENGVTSPAVVPDSVGVNEHTLATVIHPAITDPRMYMNLSCGLPPESLLNESHSDTFALSEVPQEMRIVVVTVTPERLAYLMYGVLFPLYYATTNDDSEFKPEHPHPAFAPSRVYFGLPKNARGDNSVVVNYVTQPSHDNVESTCLIRRRKKMRMELHEDAPSDQTESEVGPTATLEEMLRATEVQAAARKRVVQESEDGAPTKTPEEAYKTKQLDAIELDTFSFRPGDVVLFRCTRNKFVSEERIKHVVQCAMMHTRTHFDIGQHVTAAQVCSKAIRNAVKMYASNDLLFHAVGIVDKVLPDARLHVMRSFSPTGTGRQTRAPRPATKAFVERSKAIAECNEQHNELYYNVYEHSEYNVCSFAPHGLRSITQEGMSVERLLRDYIRHDEHVLQIHRELFVMDPHIDGLLRTTMRETDEAKWRCTAAYTYTARQISYAANVDLFRWWNGHRRLWQTRQQSALKTPVVECGYYTWLREGIYYRALLNEMRTYRGVYDPETQFRARLSMPRQLPRDIDQVITAVLNAASRARIRRWIEQIPLMDTPSDGDLTALVRSTGRRMMFTKPVGKDTVTMFHTKPLLEQLKQRGKHALAMQIKQASRRAEFYETLRSFFKPIQDAIPPVPITGAQSTKHGKPRAKNALGCPNTHVSVLLGEKRDAEQALGSPQNGVSRRRTGLSHGHHVIPPYFNDDRMRRLDALDFALSKARCKQYVLRALQEMERHNHASQKEHPLPTWADPYKPGQFAHAIIRYPSEEQVSRSSETRVSQDDSAIGRDISCWFPHYGDRHMYKPWYRTPLIRVLPEHRLTVTRDESGQWSALDTERDIWDLTMEHGSKDMAQVVHQVQNNFWRLGFDVTKEWDSVRRASHSPPAQK